MDKQFKKWSIQTENLFDTSNVKGKKRTSKIINTYIKIFITTIVISSAWLSCFTLYMMTKQPIMNYSSIVITAPRNEPGESGGIIREVTMYNVGDPNQTDDSPCISANGENICNAVALGYKRCAANFVPLGTDLYIDNYGECKVTDRMNSRYKNRVDIAVSADEYQRAINFGLQHLLVTIK